MVTSYNDIKQNLAQTINDLIRTPLFSQRQINDIGARDTDCVEG